MEPRDPDLRKGENMRRALEALRRLYWIDAALTHDQRPTAVRLAGEVGVSRGTIYRDLARLRDEHKAPVIFDPSSGGFHYGRAFNLDLPDLSYEIALALGRSLRRQDRLAGTALEGLLRRLWESAQLLVTGEAQTGATGPGGPAPLLSDTPAPGPRRARQRLGERVGLDGGRRPEPIDLRLRFDQAAVPELLSGGFLRRKDVQFLTDGGIEAQITTRDPDALLLDLLCWAPHFEIASPAWIRRRLPVLLRAMLRHWEPKRARAKR
jgi:predicted DNA-binding transcriptional regulator YafY